MVSWPAPDNFDSPSASDRMAERALREEVREELKRLLGEGEPAWGLAPGPEDEERIRQIIGQRVADYQRRAALTNGTLIGDPAGLEQRLFAGFLGMGILEPWIRDPRCEELFINAPHRVLAIIDGQMQLLQDVCFEDDDEVRQLVRRLIAPTGRRLDEASPMVDARLPDGSRLNACIPPVTSRYCTVAIRKFILRANTMGELISLHLLDEEPAAFLDAAVQADLNMLLSGVTGCGKTTLLNCLASYIPATDRCVTIEEVPELRLEAQLPNCVALYARPGNIEGEGEIRVRELVRNALRMRPDRIIVGEVRGGEAFDMLLALSTGHDGSFCTLHASSPRDALMRLAVLAMMSDEKLGKDAALELVAGTIDLVAQMRFNSRTGQRRIVSIYEVAGLQGNVLTGQELWAWDAQRDRLVWRGVAPRCLAKMAERGVDYTPPPARLETLP